MGRSIYYSLLFIALGVSTLLVPTYLAENAELQWINSELSALEGERSVDDPDVKSILDRGTLQFKQQYVGYVSIISVIMCFVAIGLTLGFKKAGNYDSLYLLAFFSVLFLIGVLEPVSFGVITVICALGFIARKYLRGSSRKRSN